MNTEERIEEIVNTDTSVKLRVDALLELDRDNMDLGLGCTKEALKEARNNSKKIYRAIKKLDRATGELLLNHVDR